MLFPGLLTSCRKLWNHFSTLPTISHLLATLFNDLHFCAHLLDSPQLSFHLSSPLNSFELVLAHLASVPPVQFFLSPVEVTQLQTNFLVQASWIAFPFDVVSAFDCVIILVSCAITQSSWTVDCYLWVQRSSTLGPQHFFHAREELWRHEQPSVKRARKQPNRRRLWVLLPERPNEQEHASCTAVRATGMQQGVANAGSTAVRCFFSLQDQVPFETLGFARNIVFFRVNGGFVAEKSRLASATVLRVVALAWNHSGSARAM